MRSVFVRHREKMKAMPAWMGGLNYDELGLPTDHASRKLTLAGESSAPDSEGRVTTGQASGAATRVAMHSEFLAQPHGGSASGQDEAWLSGSLLYTPPLVPSLFTFPSRPITAGTYQTDAARQLPTRQLKTRPVTAGTTTQRRPSNEPHEGENRSAKKKKEFHGIPRPGSQTQRGQNRPDSAGILGQPQGHQRHSKALAVFPGKKVFYTLIVRILGVKGTEGLSEASKDQSKTPEQENLMYAHMVLNVEGISHHSKPIRMQNHRSVMVPDETFSFELQGDVSGSLLSVKLNRRWYGESKDAHEIGTAYVELASCLHAGGHMVVQSKLSNDAHIGSVGEAQLDLRLQSRPLDFTFSYVGEEPFLKKAGYLITPRGIQTMPQQYKKGGLPQGETLRTLVMEKFVSTEVEGFQVYRAVDSKAQHSYTVKRFMITGYDPRCMLVNELDGLIDCPSHQAIVPLDAFLDRLEVVLVLDDMGGKYLRDVVEKKGKLPEQNGSIVLRQVLQALKFLHENKMRVHNDIDARNILVLPTGDVRLGGFCYSTKNLGMSQKFSGPYIHMSPERLLGLSCGFASDSWSVGILAMELLTGKLPYDMAAFTGPSALFNFKKMVVTEPSPNLKRGDDYSDEVRLFVDSCLHKNLKLRLSVSGLLSHPFITKYETFVPNFLGRWISRDTTGRKRRTSVYQNLNDDLGGEKKEGTKEKIFSLIHKASNEDDND